MILTAAGTSSARIMRPPWAQMDFSYLLNLFREWDKFGIEGCATGGVC